MQMTAETIMPLFLVLPLEEQQAFVSTAVKLISKKDIVKKKVKTHVDKVCEVLGEKYRPGNEEMLVTEIMMS